MTPWPTRNRGQVNAQADIPLEDQIAIGIVNVADSLEGMIDNLPASIRPRDRSSLWATALSFMGWSNGVGGASNHIKKYERQLAAVPESQRWLALVRAVAADTTDRTGATYRSAAYSVNRANQKIRVGRGLARSVGGNLAWFGEVDEAAEDILARRASSVPVTGTGPALPSGDNRPDDDVGDRRELALASTAPPAAVIVGVIAAAAAFAGYVIYRAGRQRERGVRNNPGRRRRGEYD
jgi:hypothetical protein